MPCYHPLKAWRPRSGTQPVFDIKAGWADRPLFLPCGQCVGCRLERSRQWAVRCMHEASLHLDNCFITLTYSDEHLPSDLGLHKDHFQKFMKRLRDRVGYGRIRFYMCGEYGETFRRPHFHACLFGYDFPDKQVFRRAADGSSLFRSSLLEDLWQFGYSSIGEVTFDSAAYVARYVMKKRTGPIAWRFYDEIDSETGEVLVERCPEYNDMSRRPGIGSAWIDRFRSDVYPSDFLVVNGVKARPPRFYDKRFEVEFPSDFSRIRGARVERARGHADNNTPDRLKVREVVAKAKLGRFKRSVE